MNRVSFRDQSFLLKSQNSQPVFNAESGFQGQWELSLAHQARFSLASLWRKSCKTGQVFGFSDSKLQNCGYWHRLCLSYFIQQSISLYHQLGEESLMKIMTKDVSGKSGDGLFGSDQESLSMLRRACSSRGRIFPFFLPMQSYSFILFLLQSPDDASAAIKDISAFYNFRHTDYLPGILLLLSVGEKKKKFLKMCFPLIRFTLFQ